jgi:hypothetical protein
VTEVNVVSGDGWSEGESAALMTATVFTLARVPPIMGRALLAADEVPGAGDVAVVGYSFWRRRLGGAHDVVGTTLRIAGVPTTIVGVMPEGFAMPSVQQLGCHCGRGPPTMRTGSDLACGYTAGSPMACRWRRRVPS